MILYIIKITLYISISQRLCKIRLVIGYFYIYKSLDAWDTWGEPNIEDAIKMEQSCRSLNMFDLGLLFWLKQEIHISW